MMISSEMSYPFSTELNIRRALVLGGRRQKAFVMCKVGTDTIGFNFLSVGHGCIDLGRMTKRQTGLGFSTTTR